MNVAAQNTPRRRQEDRRASSTAAMLDAAVELIGERGSNVSLKDIGERAGFSHGLVLSRFGSKAGLLLEVTRIVQRQFSADVGKAVGDSQGLAALTAITDSFFAGISRKTKAGGAFYVLLGEALGPQVELREIFSKADNTFRNFLCQFLKGAQHSGEIPTSVDIEATAALLVGMLRGSALQLKTNPKAFDTPSAAKQARSLIANLATD